MIFAGIGWIPAYHAKNQRCKKRHKTHRIKQHDRPRDQHETITGSKPGNATFPGTARYVRVVPSNSLSLRC
ncbi:hypothetical protein FIBSPDRAFT_175801 [Athelia psychrophila]|uniref:Uncharacterized protein n=1 Tax=Athelia psychrophila TaxID=1759441 RepID=A0A166AL98_9AGAM|nr:hypothetical protein FIBSPDRAFT_175801 [Fibularhizoctonia sp. CBS 109695]